ncbi:hypothetical protein HMPREF0290_2579 [Corynebacterium efficiens YS-314]|nr:hypothetical protein HMPREF0290_2579 [Corynebacterium efficiens YS-314]
MTTTLVRSADAMGWSEKSNKNHRCGRDQGEYPEGKKYHP